MPVGYRPCAPPLKGIRNSMRVLLWRIAINREFVTIMRLTAYTDYTLRTLIHLGLNRGRMTTIPELAKLQGISKNHLMKVVHQLGQAGLVHTVRGRNGGFRLQMEPSDINIGKVVRKTESDFFLAERAGCESSSQVDVASCALMEVLNLATTAYLDVLDGVTLVDLMRGEGRENGRNAIVSVVHVRPNVNNSKSKADEAL